MLLLSLGNNYDPYKILGKSKIVFENEDGGREVVFGMEIWLIIDHLHRDQVRVSLTVERASAGCVSLWSCWGVFCSLAAITRHMSLLHFQPPPPTRW
jgi:hypothetical protein